MAPAPLTATQGADGWHLLANMRQAVERWLHGAQARLRRLPVVPGGDKPAVPARRDRALRRSAPERAAGTERRAIATFAAGLDTDRAAVRTAVTRPWSSGQAEPQINRLKLLKRQSYGPTSFDLLRRRVLKAA